MGGKAKALGQMAHMVLHFPEWTQWFWDRLEQPGQKQADISTGAELPPCLKTHERAAHVAIRNYFISVIVHPKIRAPHALH